MMPAMQLPQRLGDVTRDMVRNARALDYVRYLSCLGYVNVPRRAAELFLERFPDAFSASDVKKALSLDVFKAAIPPGTTTGPDWVKPLVGIAQLADGFVALARSESVLGRIPGLRSVPFMVNVPFQTGGAIYKWVKQGDPKPATKLAFSDGVTLTPTKGAGIPVITREVGLLLAPGSDVMLRDDLIAGLVEWTDKQLLDPTIAPVADTNPGSITYGTTPVIGTGNLQVDVQALLKAFWTGRPGARTPALVANGENAAALRGMNPGFGLPIIDTPGAGANIVALDGSGVVVADRGVEIEASTEAMLQMDDAPTTPPATVTSLWQANLIGYSVERFVNWAAVPNAVKYLAPAAAGRQRS
jgi:hypothetical protein